MTIVNQYDSTLDELRDHINRLMPQMINDFNEKSIYYSPSQISPIIYSITMQFFTIILPEFNKNLAEIACIFVYEEDFQNSEKDYYQWVKDSIIQFFTKDKLKNQYESEMKMSSLIDCIINNKDLRGSFHELLLHSIVVLISLATNNKNYKTVDEFYPDGNDYHWYSYIFDVTSDNLNNIKYNLEAELKNLNIMTEILDEQNYY